MYALSTSPRFDSFIFIPAYFSFSLAGISFSERYASADAEWLETEGLLLRARIEADSDSWGTALQLVQKACRQAELALQQAEYESKAWKNRVVD